MHEDELGSPDQEFSGDDITQPCGGEEHALSDVEQAQLSTREAANPVEQPKAHPLAERLAKEVANVRYPDMVEGAVGHAIVGYLNEPLTSQRRFYDSSLRVRQLGGQIIQICHIRRQDAKTDDTAHAETLGGFLFVNEGNKIEGKEVVVYAELSSGMKGEQLTTISIEEGKRSTASDFMPIVDHVAKIVPSFSEKLALSDVGQTQKITAGTFKQTAMSVFGAADHGPLFDWLAENVKKTVQRYLNEKCGKQGEFKLALLQDDDTKVFAIKHSLDERRERFTFAEFYTKIGNLAFSIKQNCFVVQELPASPHLNHTVLLRAGLDKLTKPESIDFTKLCAFLDKAIEGIPDKPHVPMVAVSVANDGNTPHR